MVSLRNEIIAFNIKNDVVSEDFLLREIMGKKVETQGLALATGVTIPVLPTWYVISLRRVHSRSALNLYAIAQRGDLAVRPSCSC